MVHSLRNLNVSSMTGFSSAGALLELAATVAIACDAAAAAVLVLRRPGGEGMDVGLGSVVVSEVDAKVSLALLAICFTVEGNRGGPMRPLALVDSEASEAV